MLIQTKSPTRFNLNVRIPYWAENASVSINGKPWESKEKLSPSTYAKIDRTWKNGDRVEVKLPMRLHLQTVPDDQNLAAILYGPVVLAGELGTQNLDPKHIYSEDKILHAGFPAIPIPQLSVDRNALDKWIQPILTKDKPLNFRATARGVLPPQDVTLSPFYRLFNQRYNVYWRFNSPVNA